MFWPNVAMDDGRLGIRCNCLCPGFIETPLFDQVLGRIRWAPVGESERVVQRAAVGSERT